ncbi:Uncharacterised protein [Candidatus Tiddalikarchaeum anstoanum]|nr:Uncharacterised protein [Candidatus Tiddalikarchaeum anstoanum]
MKNSLGDMIENLLFLCNQGRCRSKTAAYLFNDRFRTKYAGIYAKADNSTEDRTLKEDYVKWADLIFVMQFDHVDFLNNNYPLLISNKIINLDIPDKFYFLQPELVTILNYKVAESLKTKGVDLGSLVKPSFNEFKMYFFKISDKNYRKNEIEIINLINVLKYSATYNLTNNSTKIIETSTILDNDFRISEAEKLLKKYNIPYKIEIKNVII